MDDIPYQNGATEKAELAKQLVTYADAITAFSFAQSVGLVYAMVGQKEFRIVLVEGKCFPLMGIFVGYGLYLYLVKSCHDGEDKLLGEPSKRAEIGDTVRKVRRLRRGIVIAAGFMSALTFFLMWVNPPRSQAGCGAGASVECGVEMLK